MDMESTPEQQEEAWFLKTSYPVSFPSHDALTQSTAEFESFLVNELCSRRAQASNQSGSTVAAGRDASTSESKPAGHPFMEGLHSFVVGQQSEDNGPLMRTANGDVTYRSASNAIVDLFAELQEDISDGSLTSRLDDAWAADPLLTLKIIFNARSIHLGKSSRSTFYRCAGWLADNHPLTLAANLRWLSRPVIEKKVQKQEEGEDDIVLVEQEKNDEDISRHDVRHGVAHGYWKDLLNILALAVNEKLHAASDPSDVLNVRNPGKRGDPTIIKRGSTARGRGQAGRGRGWGATRGRVTMAIRGGRGGLGAVQPDKPSRNRFESTPMNFDVSTAAVGDTVRGWPLIGKELRHFKRDKRHTQALDMFACDPIYRALHLTVARLFAEQLQIDLAALRGDDAKAKRTISLCGKWAPSHDRFHDRHTFIVSSIAEILHPRESLDHLLSPTDDRDAYLCHAREQYRKDVSALRRHLEIVERNLSAKTYHKIKYDRVPSVAMKMYTPTFIKRDPARFETYIEKVSLGEMRISGATLLPSTLVASVMGSSWSRWMPQTQGSSELMRKVSDGQWKALVNRIKQSGTLSSSIAVCDVSGSMQSPSRQDGTTPLHSAIGLSLLLAEVTEPPFGGSFITFSSTPEVVKVDLTQSLSEKCTSMERANWGASTNFRAVFLDCILPMAVKNKLKQEDMVKRVFVFSDMQFDSCGGKSHESSYGTICAEFEKAGYEVPELVFWNLAAGDGASMTKPVTTTDQGTCLVSGYSQGMMKVFLDNGSFAGADEEEQEAEEGDEEDEEKEEAAVVLETGADGEVVEAPKKKKVKLDPLRFVKKATGHKAYDMLQVLD